ncbi:MAG: indole-3-glycerol phosphate synthase TrpC [Acidimicrobiales bacterium]|jgi:indole-3-glycerol phosphate synthase
MTATYLDDIVRYHRERAERDTRLWQERLGGVHYRGASLVDALAPDATSNVKVIAEVKRRSPSKGWLDEDLDVAQVARDYTAGGASAISVLTDGPHFAGSSEDVAVARTETDLPLLRKDFTVCANDVLDAAEMGAAAVLLIVAALDDEELALLSSVGVQCGLAVVVEVHDHEEARRALDVGARLIGVNQRDLRTFDVNADRAAEVIESLPPDVVTVAESGLRTVSDVERAARAGFDAVLVGESFIRASDRVQAVRTFAGVARVARA